MEDTEKLCAAAGKLGTGENFIRARGHILTQRM